MVETVLWGVLSVALAVALALGGFAVARRLVSFDLREAQNTNTAGLVLEGVCGAGNTTWRL